MTTRRSFIGLLAAGAAALGLSRFGRASPGSTAREPVRRGVPGVTYFRAAEKYRDAAGKPFWGIPNGTGLYLNGRNVTGEASEADLAGGWVRMYAVASRNPDGTVKAFAVDVADRNLPQYVAFGRVELRPAPPGDPPTFYEQREAEKLNAALKEMTVHLKKIDGAMTDL